MSPKVKRALAKAVQEGVKHGLEAALRELGLLPQPKAARQRRKVRVKLKPRTKIKARAPRRLVNDTEHCPESEL